MLEAVNSDGPIDFTVEKKINDDWQVLRRQDSQNKARSYHDQPARRLAARNANVLAFGIELWAWENLAEQSISTLTEIQNIVHMNTIYCIE